MSCRNMDCTQNIGLPMQASKSIASYGVHAVVANILEACMCQFDINKIQC
jgi:hypothetical protein